MENTSSFSWRRFALDALLVGAAVTLFATVRRLWAPIDLAGVPWWTNVPAALAMWAVFTSMFRPAVWWFAVLDRRFGGRALAIRLAVWGSTCALFWTGVAALPTWGASAMIDLPAVRTLLGADAAQPRLSDTVSWRGVLAVGLFPLLPWFAVGVPFLLLPGARRPE